MSEHSSDRDLSGYFNAHDMVARRRAEQETAVARLDIELIKERWWELRSQAEPLNTITGGNREERDRILQALFYVVVGRMPRKEETP